MFLVVPVLSKPQGAIKYEQDELAACKSLVDQCLSDDPDTIISYASISFKEQGVLDNSLFNFERDLCMSPQVGVVYVIVLKFAKCFFFPRVASTR